MLVFLSSELAFIRMEANGKQKCGVISHSVKYLQDLYDVLFNCLLSPISVTVKINCTLHDLDHSQF